MQVVHLSREDALRRWPTRTSIRHRHPAYVRKREASRGTTVNTDGDNPLSLRVESNNCHCPVGECKARIGGQRRGQSASEPGPSDGTSFTGCTFNCCTRVSQASVLSRVHDFVVGSRGKVDGIVINYKSLYLVSSGVDNRE